EVAAGKFLLYCLPDASRNNCWYGNGLALILRTTYRFVFAYPLIGIGIPDTGICFIAQDAANHLVYPNTSARGGDMLIIELFGNLISPYSIIIHGEDTHNDPFCILIKNFFGFPPLPPRRVAVRNYPLRVESCLNFPGNAPHGGFPHLLNILLRPPVH